MVQKKLSINRIKHEKIKNATETPNKLSSLTVITVIITTTQFYRRPRDSLPAGAEGLVGGAHGQGQGLPLGEHLTGDVEVRAVLLVQAREAQHGVLEQSLVALLLSFAFEAATGSGGGGGKHGQVEEESTMLVIGACV